MNTFLGRRRDVYAYFNNDAGGHAPRNAQTLLQQLQFRSRESRSSAKKPRLRSGARG
jgi:uncharacterized protein YecE (DUF72 family)